MVVSYERTVLSAMLFDVCCSSINWLVDALTITFLQREPVYTLSRVDRCEILESGADSMDPVLELGVP